MVAELWLRHQCLGEGSSEKSLKRGNFHVLSSFHSFCFPLASLSLSVCLPLAHLLFFSFWTSQVVSYIIVIQAETSKTSNNITIPSAACVCECSACVHKQRMHFFMPDENKCLVCDYMRLPAYVHASCSFTCMWPILACVYVCVPPLSALWTAGQLTPQRGWISISNHWHNSACLLTATSLPWGRLYKRHGYQPWDQMKKDESGAERHTKLFRISQRALINNCSAPIQHLWNFFFFYCSYNHVRAYQSCTYQ